MSQRGRIGVIVNCNARLFKSGVVTEEKLKKILSPDDLVIATKSLEDLPRAIQKFRDEGITYIALPGGDGSISQGLSVIHKVYPPNQFPTIIITGGGTNNIICKHLQFKHAQVERNLEKAIQAVHSGNAEILKLKTILGNGIVGVAFGTGLSPNFLKIYNRKPGMVNAVILMAKIVLHVILTIGGLLFKTTLLKELLATQDEDITLDGKSIGKRKPLLTFACTINSFGFGTKLFPKNAASPNTGFQFLASYTSLLGLLPAFILFKPLRGARIAEVDEFLKESAIIQADHTLDFFADGELFNSPNGKLEMYNGPMVPVVKV